MNDIAIKVENLGKKYVINHKYGKSDDNFREAIIGNTKKAFNKLNPFSTSVNKEIDHTTEDFWALNDINFEIKKGDKVGIIGRNGAGKSTLLKVLSRITEPTTGKIHINGRIASLLEVGTGFHPELTGRENIYLNGAILGMSRKEIKAKFDEIVAFAEVDKFLDTPVKRYSSGMYVRLAFSVAAHLEPEILVVDEVLAVGDVAFQKKCLGKMDDVAKEGRTILFVSHNMNAITQLCDRGILMSDGKCKYFNSTLSAIEQYNTIDPLIDYRELDKFRSGTGLSRKVEFNEIYYENENYFETGSNVEFYIKVAMNERVRKLRTSLTIFSQDGTPVGSSFSYEIEIKNTNKLQTFKVVIPRVNLSIGNYYMGLALGKGNNKTALEDYDILLNVLHFEMREDKKDKFVSTWPKGWGNVVFDTLELIEE